MCVAIVDTESHSRLRILIADWLVTDEAALSSELVAENAELCSHPRTRTPTYPQGWQVARQRLDENNAENGKNAAGLVL